MKKLISLLLSAVMAFSVTGAYFNVYAEEASSLTVIVTGTQANETVKLALDEINDERLGQGGAALETDKQLTKVARLAAEKAMLHVDSDFTLPSGLPFSLMLPEINQTAFAASALLENSETETVKEKLSQFLNIYDSALSIGAAVFICNNTVVFFAVCSTVPAGEIETNFNTQIVTYRETVLRSYLNQGIIDLSPVKNGKYNLSMRVSGSGYSSDMFDVAASDVVYRSSNANIFKIKGTNGYAKKTGTVTVTSYTKDGKVLIQGKLPCNATTISPVITFLKSQKKKQATVKWSKNITNANGYQLQYGTNKKFKNAKTIIIKKRKTVSKIIKKLKSGKKYYFRVRAYVDQGENEKLFTPWSAKKSVKIK